MNKGFAKYQGDPYFNEKFATGLGPEGTLRFWASVAEPQAGNPYSRAPAEHSKERLKQLAALQDNLGMALGSATQSDSPAMQAWEKKVIDLGGSRLDVSSGPYGFQVMSNLMREGDYDSKFLKDYGKALMDDDKRFSKEPFHPYQHWMYNNESDLNFGAKDDRGQDPVTGFMEALGHNPGASTDFFSTKENLDYLAKDREWPSDSTGGGDSKGSAGYRSMSHALEAATTGHDYDVNPSKDLPPHSKAQAELMKSVVEGVSKGDFKLHDGMQLSLGQMTAEYMPDVHHALSGGKAGGDTLNDLYPHHGSLAVFSEQDITRFMYEVGQDPEGYKAINIGQTQYTSDLINYHFAHPDVYDTSEDGAERALRQIAAKGGEVEGILGLARQDSDIQKSAEGDAKFNENKDTMATWAKSLTSIGIGVGIGAATSPVGGALAAVALDDISGQIIDGMFGDPKDSSDKALYDTGKNLDAHKQSTMTATQNAANLSHAAHDSGMTAATIETAVREGVHAGNGNAHDVLREYREKRGKS